MISHDSDRARLAHSTSAGGQIRFVTSEAPRPESPPRVLLIASELPPSATGVAHTVGRLVSGLRNRGYEVDTLSSADSGYLVFGEFRLSGLVARWPQVARVLDSYDVVNIHGPCPTISDVYLLLMRTVRRAQRPAVVYTHHFTIDLDRWRFPEWVYDKLAQRLGRLADRVLVTTHAYRWRLRSRHGPQPVVVPWGVDYSRFSGSRHDSYDASRPLRVLFVGQFRPYKGIPNLVEAVRGDDRFELSIVGSGPLGPRLRMLTADIANVRLLGKLDEPALREAYLSHDVVALPSTTLAEAFGLVLLEGMASGCVPVATSLPGLAEVAGPSGIVVPPGDAGALHDALAKLAADPELVATLQKRSRARAAEFAWEVTLEGYEDAFEAVCSGIRRRAASSHATGAATRRQGPLRTPPAPLRGDYARDERS